MEFKKDVQVIQRKPGKKKKQQSEKQKEETEAKTKLADVKS